MQLNEFLVLLNLQYIILQTKLLPADGSDGPRGKDAGRDSVWTPGCHSVYERFIAVTPNSIGDLLIKNLVILGLQQFKSYYYAC